MPRPLPLAFFAVPVVIAVEVAVVVADAVFSGAYPEAVVVSVVSPAGLPSVAPQPPAVALPSMQLHRPTLLMSVA